MRKKKKKRKREKKKDKPLSLAPLSYDDAVRSLLKVKPPKKAGRKKK